MNFLTQLSLKRPVSICLAVLALLVFGASAIMGTPMELMPEINMPMIMIITPYPGAAPQDVENLVTEHMEDAASALTGVKNINCISSENMSLVMIEFEYGTDMQDIKSDLRGNIDIQENYFPDDVSSPTLIEMRSDMEPTMILSATAVGDVDLYSFVDEYVKPKIKQINGVANVDIMGGDKRYISVTLKEADMLQYGLSMDTVKQVIKNADFSIPAGDIAQGDVDLMLRGGVDYKSVYSLNNIPITLKTGDVISLQDIADIGFAVPKKDSVSKTNDVDDIMIAITKRQSASTFSVTDGVNKIVRDMNNDAKSVELTVLDDASVMIKSSVSSVFQTMLWGILLAMLVLFMFFGDWKASVIVGVSIPLSILVTVIAMHTAGFSFNILSLGGLVIGIGMMVDNSIVVLESCFRNSGGQKSLKEAVIDGAAAVSTSIFASTLTTVVVFLPIAFIKGMAGQLFGQLCFTIVFSLIASLISAVGIVPLVFYKLIPKQKEHKLMRKVLSNLEESYIKFLPKTLRHKGIVVIVAVLLFVGSILLIPLVGVELIPQTDEGTVTLSVETREGLNVEASEKIIEPIVKMVSSHPDVQKYSVTIGSQGLLSIFRPSEGDCTVTAYLKSDREMTTKQVVDLMRRKTADMVDCKVKVDAQSTTSMMSGGGNIEVPIKGYDYDTLVEASYKVEDFVSSNPDIINVSSTVASGSPQAEIKVDPIKSGANGLLPAQVMATVRNFMVGTEATTLNQDESNYSVRVEYPKDRYKSVSDLDALIITNPAGKGVPLKDISTIEYNSSPESIKKENGQYIITVSGQPSLTASTKLNSIINNGAMELELPQGAQIGKSQQLEHQAEEFGTLYGAIMTAIFLVFLVMAMQFESPMFSLVVMLCVPFSLIGSFLALFLSGTSVSMPSLMGFLMLVGTVVNNGILFIDTTNRLRKLDGYTPEAALAKAGTMRLRPILMTTLTTILAMVPLAIGLGENGALMRGMAMVIIGGLTASTILSLLLLPSFYLLFNRFGKKNKVKKRKKAKRTKEIR